ncbi:MAG: hypothetical protein AAFN30_11885 [Actinomycetota bacterium]
MTEPDGSPRATGSGGGRRAEGEPVADQSGNEPTIPLPAVRVDRPNSQLGRQIAVGAAVAAVALLAVVSAVLGTGGADSAAEASEKELSASCEAYLLPLAEAIEDWEGVGQWAAAGAGQPDLGTMTLAAVEDLATLEATSDLGVAALALQRGLADAADDPEGMATAVLDALEATASSLVAAPAPGACQTSRLQAAIAMG